MLHTADCALPTSPCNECGLKVAAFCAALTELCDQYGYGISETATLFLMEEEDRPYSYQIDLEGKLIRL